MYLMCEYRDIVICNAGLNGGRRGSYNLQTAAAAATAAMM